jgi:hypothetical protein
MTGNFSNKPIRLDDKKQLTSDYRFVDFVIFFLYYFRFILLSPNFNNFSAHTVYLTYLK